MPTSELVSLQNIRAAFLEDRYMMLSCELNPIMVLEIYHVEGEDEPSDMCFAFLEVGTKEIQGTPACSSLVGDSHPLDEIIQAFQLDIYRAMWAIGQAE